MSDAREMLRLNFKQSTALQSSLRTLSPTPEREQDEDPRVAQARILLARAASLEAGGDPGSALLLVRRAREDLDAWVESLRAAQRVKNLGEPAHMVDVPDTCRCKPAVLDGTNGDRRVLHQICCPTLTAR